MTGAPSLPSPILPLVKWGIWASPYSSALFRVPNWHLGLGGLGIAPHSSPWREQGIVEGPLPIPRGCGRPAFLSPGGWALLALAGSPLPLPLPLVSPLQGQAGCLLWSLHLWNTSGSQEYLSKESTHRLCHLPRLPAGLLTPHIYLLHLQAALSARDAPASPPTSDTPPSPARAQLSPECPWVH